MSLPPTWTCGSSLSSSFQRVTNFTEVPRNSAASNLFKSLPMGGRGGLGGCEGICEKPGGFLFIGITFKEQRADHGFRNLRPFDEASRADHEIDQRRELPGV